MKATQSILTVTDLTRRIKTTLEQSFTHLTVQGEISNCKLHSSGHLYFTLKDESSQISAVMWRSRVGTLFFTPKDGMKVIARGNITVYEVRGQYQIDIQQIQPLGVGELQMAFEKLKQQLSEEGLFDTSHKKRLPRFPQRIGIVTSPTGAAIRDMINIIERRYPCVEIILYPVKVQGEGAALEIATAINDFNIFRGVDVLIIGRGGGSLEDLWAFNEEIVARAIYRSAIPIISAVGHEVDVTISDYVADLRAPTPSAAAELVVPQREDLVEIVRNFYYTSEQIVRDRLSLGRENIRSLLESYSFNKPFDMIRQFSQHSDELRQTIYRTVSHRLILTQQQCSSLEKRMASLHPDKVLERGYTMIMRENRVISSSQKLHARDEITVRFKDGNVAASVGSKDN